jgi:CRP-like cAMP-binding protein
VKLIKTLATGDDSFVSWLLGDTLVGAESVISRTPSEVSAVAVSHVDVAQIEASSFAATIEREDINLSWKLHQQQSEQIVTLRARAAERDCCSARDRLMAFFAEHLVQQGAAGFTTPTRLRCPFSQAEIAAAVAIRPEVLSRLYRHMEHDGLVRREKGRIMIANPRNVVSYVMSVGLSIPRPRGGLSSPSRPPALARFR